jgi:DNA-binding response OmpR family regulator
MANVLVIEDDTLMATMLRSVLSTRFQVAVCTEKAHAIRLAKEHLLSEDIPNPDCVVIDLIINGVGGVEFYHWMRGEGFHCPVIFLTGCHQQSPEYRAALNTGEQIYEKDYFMAGQFLEEVATRVAMAARSRAD